MHSARFTAGLALAAMASLVGCRSDRASTAAESPSTASPAAAAPATVNITAKDFAFEAPASIPAGVTTMRLVNQGTQLHHAQLIKLEDGKSLVDLAQALKNPGSPPSWVKLVGGPNAVPPGREANATAVLVPGRYAYLCLIFGADMVVHAAKGMMHQFEVTGDSSVTAAEQPAPTATIKLNDYGFEPSTALAAGRHTIRVENAGPQPHELALLKLAPGKTVEDFAHWAEGGMKGPPPAEPIGGVVGLDKGGSSTFTADLTAGNYGLICFVPDAKDGKPHLAHGMMKTIMVS
jgi:plastocyanin